MEVVHEVPKVWGKEVVVVNCQEYAAKLLVIDQGAACSYHCHPKKETFFVLEGEVQVTIEGEDETLIKGSRRSLTVRPNQYHQFYGVISSIIMEVSTHDDGQVERLTPSLPGRGDA